MSPILQNFNDHQGLVIIRFNGVAEIIQRFKDFVQDFSGGLIRIIPDDIQQPLVAEHFSMGVNRFFDAVGSDQNDLPGVDLFLKSHLP